MKRPEQALHIAVAAYLGRALRAPTLWTTIGHGGGGRTRGAFLKAMGVQAGWPDIIVLQPTPRGDTDVIALELKAPKGKLSDAQEVTRTAMENANCLYFVCRSVDEVEDELRLCGVPLYATTGMRAA